MKTSIVILTYNQLNYTIQCIESIRQYTTPDTYEIIIVDNNSTDETRHWLSQQSDIITILNDSNLGFPKGCNQGMEVATGDYILLLNNDTIVTKNWLNNLLYCINSDERFGAVSCITNNCSYAQTIPVTYNNLHEMHAFAASHNVSDQSKWEQRLKLIGFCYLIKRSVVDEIGLLDERFTPGNYEDDDYSLRIRKAGYELVLCKDTFIHHYGSVSFREDSSYSKLMKDNAKKFEEKWGFNPIYSQHIRFEIINMMDSDTEAPLNVLEVGCACGGTLMNIKHRYPNSNLYGIELDEAASSVASMIADVRNYDVERGVMKYDDNFFDYIILADVLEHLYDPWKVLKNLKRYLKTDGKILVSIPNLMHYTVINGLLEGSFTYTDAGILDRTHLRFFTLQELKKMILQSGYYKLDIAAKTLPNKDKGTTDRLSGIVSPAVMEQFNVYQYLVSAKKHDLEETFEYIKDHTEETQAIVNRVSAYTADEVIQSVLLSVNENQAELLNIIGVSHFSEGCYEKVLPFFENAFYLDNNNDEILYNISYFLCFVGESSNASQFIDRLKEVNEKSYNQLLEIIKDFN